VWVGMRVSIYECECVCVSGYVGRRVSVYENVHCDRLAFRCYHCFLCWWSSGFLLNFGCQNCQTASAFGVSFDVFDFTL
jgi:hypothetical protein